MRDRGSILKKFFLAGVIGVTSLIIASLFIIYEINSLRGWSTTVNFTAILRYSSQSIPKEIGSYYLQVCINKKEGETILRRIEEANNRVTKTIQTLNTGGQGIKSIPKIGREDLTKLLKEIEENYKVISSNFEQLRKTCEEPILNKIIESSDKVLTQADTLIKSLVQESEREVQYIFITVILASLLIPGIFAGFGIFFQRILKNALNNMDSTIRELERGNFVLSVMKDNTFREFLGIYKSISALQRAVERIMDNILKTSNILSSVGTQLKNYVNNLGPISENIDNLISQAGRVGQELTDSISDIEKSIEEMRSAIEEISKNTYGTAERARAVRGAAVEMESTVLALSKSMDEIKGITETIKSIAEQTNLLALNASIEAARAGEAGKGFAVVANEVKELAGKVTEFTNDIDKIVAHLGEMVKETTNKANETKKLVDEVENATSAIAGAVEEQTSVTNNILQDALQTKDKSFNLFTEIESLNKVGEQLKKITKELIIEANLLEELLDTLRTVPKIFTLESRAITDEELRNLSVPSIVNMAILGHLNWKMGFVEDLLRGEQPKVESDHRKCLLGRSLPILKEKVKGAEDVRLIAELEGPHEELHKLVFKAKEINLKDVDGKFNFIEREVLPIFEKVMIRLFELKALCDKMKC